jgi:hypothetical protein
MLAEPSTPNPTSIASTSSPIQPSTPRRFHLERPTAPSLFHTMNSKKRKAEIALFVEKRAKPSGSFPIRSLIAAAPMAPDMQGATEQQHKPIQERKLKRPSGRTRPNMRDGEGRPQQSDLSDLSSGDSPEFVSKMEAWAEQTEEAERGVQHINIPKPTTTEPMIRGSDEDLDMTDRDADGDYVYDTYIRHPVSPNTTIDPTVAVGHLVISEEDEELWQTYIDDDADDKEFDTDDEDSNGEYSYFPSRSTPSKYHYFKSRADIWNSGGLLRRRLPRR